jgi:RHS repeat-associated protein
MAAMALLSQKPRQGVPSRNPALHPGIDECNSTVAIGLRAGERWNRVGSRYTAKERDSESGNDYMFARYYNSNTGRFLSPDWSAKVAPVPYAKLDNPQSLNLYSYVYNNPLSRLDADGHDLRFNHDPGGLIAADFNLLASRSKSFRREMKAAQDDHTINVVVELSAFAGYIPHGAKADATMKQHWSKDNTTLLGTDIMLYVNIGNLKQDAHEMGHEHDMRTHPGQFQDNAKKEERDAGQPGYDHDKEDNEVSANIWRDQVMTEFNSAFTSALQEPQTPQPTSSGDSHPGAAANNEMQQQYESEHQN